MGPPWRPAPRDDVSGDVSGPAASSPPSRGGPRAAAAAAGPAPAQGLFPGRPRGRVLFLTDKAGSTSGRRLAAWGPLRATGIHLAISLAWYITQDAEKVEELYERLYTDKYR
ncbi:hypothetical protein MNEG_8812 [Monoraphidium neglectum]|uniref:Uncharacterized protein n=1 Tax=Monoraphidium neglectum TaxID=145388 RepID=A0A0D2MYF3_9CHLO|nr:hypothetical protein MNEG_8812 [Monoraphidium neglectum]KIY99150.1 hypothetical protein MNEG_8812 [Monoraphidium neglectum]|eukprot:XP_013898170.1 hypothetical protein MNEG_8812 [Monoraphidium neglectum]